MANAANPVVNKRRSRSNTVFIEIILYPLGFFIWIRFGSFENPY
jgi:hypothetical protein